MEAKFSPRVKDVITYSREEALRLSHDYIGPEHLLLGILREGEGVAVKLMQTLDIDLFELRKYIEKATSKKVSSKKATGNIPLVKQAEKALKITYLEAKLFKSNMIGTEHSLLALLKDEDNIATKSLEKFNVNYINVKDELEQILSNFEPKAEFSDSPIDDDDAEDADDDVSTSSLHQKK